MWISRPSAIFLLLLAILSSCSGASPGGFSSVQAKSKLKILAVFAHLGKSHFDVFKPLLEELARRGHDLTVISHFPRTAKAKSAEPLPNYKDISLLNETHGVFINVVDLKYIDDSYHRIMKELYMLYQFGNMGCDMCLRNPEVKRLTEAKEKYDVILVESFNTNCFMSLVYQFDAPFIQISTHQLMPWVIDEMGLSHEASYIPVMLSRLPRPLNFLQRTMNLLTATFMSTVYHTIFERRDHSLATEVYGPGIPSLQSISSNASLIMVNTHYTLHGATAQLPNVIEVGGLHIPPKVNPLPKQLGKFLDDAREGVLYFNLGSMVKAATMPEDKLRVLLNVFGSIPRKVVWKWEVEDLPGLPSNVLLQKWLPQYDVLNHPNVKCYFGHGGLLGLSEGVQSGVPMVLMPLYGDQYQNAIAAQARGVALVFKITELSEQTLRHSLDEIFNNTRYRDNAKKLSRAFRDRPASPLETAVWWTEYVARGNGLPYLRSDAVNMPWLQRNLVDVAIFIAAVCLLSLYLACKLFKRLTSADENSKAKRMKRD